MAWNCDFSWKGKHVNENEINLKKMGMLVWSLNGKYMEYLDQ